MIRTLGLTLSSSRMLPSKVRQSITREAEAAGLLLPLNEANQSDAMRGAQNQLPGRLLVSTEKPHASGKQHAFPLSLVCKGHPLILEQAVGLSPSCWLCGWSLGRAWVAPRRTGPRASAACSFNARGLAERQALHWGQGSPGTVTEANACGSLVPQAWPQFRQPGLLLHPNSSSV